MKQEIKEKWLAALRSGEYKQGTSCLRRNDQYCCLGVLCDLYIKETGFGKWNDPDMINGIVVFTNENNEDSIKVPDSIVSTWAELPANNPNVDDKIYEQGSLAFLNDAGKTFLEIADIIEKEL